MVGRERLWRVLVLGMERAGTEAMLVVVLMTMNDKSPLVSRKLLESSFPRLFKGGSI